VPAKKLSSPTSKNPRFFYGWLIVAAGLVIEALGYGSRYSFSVIFPVLLKDFEWSRDITALMFSVNIFIYGLTAPFAGFLVDRIGPRKTMAIGTLMLTSGLALAALSNAPWHFYLTYGILSGIGLSLAGAVPLTIIIGNWFEKYRGTAFSIVFLGAGLAHVFYPLIAFLIVTYGWGNTFVFEAIAIFVVLMPIIIIIIRFNPSDKGLKQDGVLESSNTDEIQTKMTQKNGISGQASLSLNWTIYQAVRYYRFWLLCLAAFCIWGVMQQILVAHHIAFAEDTGYTKMYASSVLALFGITHTLGSLGGIISDRIGRELTMTIATAIGVSAIIILILIKDISAPWMLYYYAIGMGLSVGMTVPLVAASVTDIFRGQGVGIVAGFVWLSFALGGTLGPWLGGWIFELTGSYVPAFSISLIAFIIGCIAIWVAAPRKIHDTN
jgi:MFS family permease